LLIFLHIMSLFLTYASLLYLSHHLLKTLTLF
jgi:hypothetical protein